MGIKLIEFAVYVEYLVDREWTGAKLGALPLPLSMSRGASRYLEHTCETLFCTFILFCM